MIDRETTWSVYTKSNSKQKYLFSSKESDDKLFSIAQKYDIDKDEETNKLFAITVGDIILGFYKIEDTVPLLQQELGLDPRTAALLGADVIDFLAPLSDPNWQPPVEEHDLDEEVEDVEIAQFVPDNNETDSRTTEAPSNPLPITNNQPHKVPPINYDADTTNTPSTHAQNDPVQPVAPVQPVYPTPNNQPPEQHNPTLHTMATDMEQARQDNQIPRTTPSLNLDDTPTYVSQNQDSLRQPLSDTPTYTPPPNTNPQPNNDNIDPPRWSDS